MDRVDEKILEAYQKNILEKKFDLGAGHKGNGITVWNKAKEVHGDYETVAHVDTNRKIKYHIKNPPKDVVKYVESIAKGKNPNASATQSNKVFKEDGGTYDKIEEGVAGGTYGGYHLKDDILSGVTVEDLETALYSNVPKEKMNAKTVKKQFDDIVKTNMKDALGILRKVAPDMVKELQKMD